MTIHKPSDFKPGYGKILDAAKVYPQYVVRDGVLIVLKRVDKPIKETVEGKSVWEALSRSAGLEITIPRRAFGKVGKVAL